MSDTKLRDLERRWKETQSVEDEAAYLLERVRVGDLTRERLELAAYCGHEGASRASSQRVARPSSFPLLLEELAHRSPMAVVFLTASLWAPVLDTQLDGRLREAWGSLVAFLSCPCDMHAAEAEQGCTLAFDYCAELEEQSGGWDRIMDQPSRCPGAVVADAVAQVTRAAAFSTGPESAFSSDFCALAIRHLERLGIPITRRVPEVLSRLGEWALDHSRAGAQLRSFTL